MKTLKITGAEVLIAGQALGDTDPEGRWESLCNKMMWMGQDLDSEYVTTIELTDEEYTRCVMAVSIDLYRIEGGDVAHMHGNEDLAKPVLKKALKTLLEIPHSAPDAGHGEHP